MIDLDPERIAAEAGAEVARPGGSGARPQRAVIDSRAVGEGDLFFGLAGERVDGGEFAAHALEAGCWGVVVTPERAARLVESEPPAPGAGGWILASHDPLLSLQALARGWRRELGCPLVGITGSTGKTTVKDVTRALLPGRVHASPENFNTEIGMPISMLAAPRETDVLVMEMGMRGPGQIAELCDIAEPDVGAITNVGPVHLELLGSIEAVAAAKAEILAGLREGGRAVVPVDSELLAPHLPGELQSVTFGVGEADVAPLEVDRGRTSTSLLVSTPAGEARFELPFTEAHNLSNALCAIAIGIAIGADPAEMASRAAGIEFSALRGEVVELPGEIVLLNDCYNANPISMRAAVEHLASIEAEGRKIAVLGGMAELGEGEAGYHAEIGDLLRELGIDLTIGVGEMARGYSPDEWVPEPLSAAELLAGAASSGDVALIKGSRSVGLEAVAEELRSRLTGAGE